MHVSILFALLLQNEWAEGERGAALQNVKSILILFCYVEKTRRRRKTRRKKKVELFILSLSLCAQCSLWEHSRAITFAGVAARAHFSPLSASGKKKKELASLHKHWVELKKKTEEEKYGDINPCPRWSQSPRRRIVIGFRGRQFSIERQPTNQPTNPFLLFFNEKAHFRILFGIHSFLCLSLQGQMGPKRGRFDGGKRPRHTIISQQ